MSRTAVTLASVVWVVAVTAVVLLSNACGPGGQQGGESGRGQQLYMANCALCHGADAQGKPALGKSLVDNEFIRSQSDEDLVQFLAEGRRANDPLNTKGVDMPPRGGNPGLSDADLQAIVSYLRGLG